jgi:hypothetical protein
MEVLETEAFLHDPCFASSETSIAISLASYKTEKSINSRKSRKNALPRHKYAGIGLPRALVSLDVDALQVWRPSSPVEDVSDSKMAPPQVTCPLQSVPVPPGYEVGSESTIAQALAGSAIPKRRPVPPHTRAVSAPDNRPSLALGSPRQLTSSKMHTVSLSSREIPFPFPESPDVPLSRRQTLTQRTAPTRALPSPPSVYNSLTPSPPPPDFVNQGRKLLDQVEDGVDVTEEEEEAAVEEPPPPQPRSTRPPIPSRPPPPVPATQPPKSSVSRFPFRYAPPDFTMIKAEDQQPTPPSSPLHRHVTSDFVMTAAENHQRAAPAWRDPPTWSPQTSTGIPSCMTIDELRTVWERVGYHVADAAAALLERSKHRLVGDGSFEGFVAEVLAEVPNALAPRANAPGGEYGFLIYAQTSWRVHTRLADIMPGDVVVLEGTTFKGYKGLHTYSMSVNHFEMCMGIVAEFDPKKLKLRVLQANCRVGQAVCSFPCSLSCQCYALWLNSV